MENNILRHVVVNYKEFLIDEIALEGLEGIGIDLLWRRIEKRIYSELTNKLKTRYWNYIVNCECLTFYQLPEPLPEVQILDRFTYVDENSGHLSEPEIYLDGPYEYAPIENEYGSCVNYTTRKAIPSATFKEKSYEAAWSEYGNNLVVVASLEERWRALAPSLPITYLTQMTPVHYCILELIGKSRWNGQMTTGKSNIIKIVKDPKTLFYNRKYLLEIDVVRVQYVTQVVGGVRGMKTLLLRLKRFHQPKVLSMPKSGLLHNILEHLLKQPDYSEKLEVLTKKGMLSHLRSKRLQKSGNIFSFVEKMIPSDDKKNKNLIKRKFICISSKSDESSDSDEESNEVPLASQYKVGVGLLRQAYERFLDAGLKGLTQVQLAQLLGVEFYTSRAICRIFRMKTIVREFLEDRGKQRTARFIAIAATGNIDVRYAEQQKKFLDYLGETSTTDTNEGTPVQTSSPKKRKLAEEKDNKEHEKQEDINKKVPEKDDTDKKVPEKINKTGDPSIPENAIVEVKLLPGFEGVKSLNSFKNKPTLRQLVFANGVLKVVQENKCICGFMTLSNLAAKEINDTPMDTKALKSFMQKLMADGHMRVYKIIWPNLQKYSLFICTPDIEKNDPILIAKYKEICMKARSAKALKTAKSDNNVPPSIKYSYPRFMKVQKLHELIFRYVYSDFDKTNDTDSLVPYGFVNVFDFLPEVTVEFAINHIISMGTTEIDQLVSPDQLPLKIKDAPDRVQKELTNNATFTNAIKINIKILAMLGLVQLIDSKEVNNSNSNGPHLLYVNRHAKIIDTTGNWPRKHVEEDIREKAFYFATIDDVLDYWNEVYAISTNTVIQLPDRNKKHFTPPVRSPDDPAKYDKGDRFGNGLGPCGFDSCFYMEISRLWKTFYSRPLVSSAVVKKKPQAPKKKVVKKPPVKKVPKKVPKIVKKIEPSHPGTRKREATHVTWTKQEDLVITMCKAAITIMSPSSQPGSLIVRNTGARDLLSIYDPKKTRSQCHNRAATLETNVTMVHEKQCIINEMRRRRHLVQKYEAFLKKLRLKYSTNISKLSSKARLPMLELVYIIHQVMRSKTYKKKVGCVALNLDEFHKKFIITRATANKLCNTYHIAENAAIKEAIIVAVMASFGQELKTDIAKKIYATFNEYPEAILRTAVDQLRRCTAIAAKEKIMNCHMRMENLNDITQSSYKMSAFYTRKWIGRLNSEFTSKLSVILESELFGHDIKGSADITCTYCEMSAYGLLDMVSDTVPVITDSAGVPISPEEFNVLTIDTKYRLKTSSLRWINKSNLKKFADLYRHLDVDSCLEYLASGVTVDVEDAKPKDIDKDDPMLIHLKNKGETGEKFKELSKLFNYDAKTLKQKLEDLESKKIVKRVGYYENIIILTEFIKPWSVNVGNKYLLSMPWLTLDGKVRISIFSNWCSVVMNLIYEKPGCSIVYIAEKTEYLTYKSIQSLCMFLEKYGCVSFKLVKKTNVDLFSDDNEGVEFEDFHPYGEHECMLVLPVNDSLCRYAYVKKKMSELDWDGQNLALLKAVKRENSP